MKEHNTKINKIDLHDFKIKKKKRDEHKYIFTFTCNINL